MVASGVPLACWDTAAPGLMQGVLPGLSLRRDARHDEVMEDVMAIELLRVTQERDLLQGRVSILETEVKNKDTMLHILGG